MSIVLRAVVSHSRSSAFIRGFHFAISGSRTTAMPRYVILTHDHPFQHWDLMLEDGGVLRTWRLLAEPAVGQSVRAEVLRPSDRVSRFEVRSAAGGAA
jgi:hypothetical protein